MPLNTGTTTEVVDCIGFKIQYAFGYLSFHTCRRIRCLRKMFQGNPSHNRDSPLANYQNSKNFEKFKNRNPWMNIVDEEWTIEG